MVIVDFQSLQGEKRPVEETDDLAENGKSPEQTNNEYVNDYVKLKKKCIFLESEVKRLQSEWMRT